MTSRDDDAGDGSALATLRSLAWEHPEWWSFVLSALAWAAMIVHGVRHFGHTHHHVMSLEWELAHWVAMVAAMMLPLMSEPLRHVAFRSLWTRRRRSMVAFLAGYFVVWAIAGVPAALVRGLSGASHPFVAAAAFVVAALWVLLPARDRALAACHDTAPLAPSGVQADVDCLRFGASVGKACVMTCWPLMLACTLTGHALVAMIGGTAIGAIDRLSFRPRPGAVLIATLALGGLSLALALSSA